VTAPDDGLAKTRPEGRLDRRRPAEHGWLRDAGDNLVELSLVMGTGEVVEKSRSGGLAPMIDGERDQATRAAPSLRAAFPTNTTSAEETPTLVRLALPSCSV
jgi:hypothetical protein